MHEEISYGVRLLLLLMTMNNQFLVDRITAIVIHFVVFINHGVIIRIDPIFSTLQHYRCIGKAHRSRQSNISNHLDYSNQTTCHRKNRYNSLTSSSG